MGGLSTNKSERQQRLTRYLESDPFLTDEDLAQILKVSVQTIRLDRFELKIPELKERLKSVAKGVVALPRTLSGREMMGELVDLDVGSAGMSILPVRPDMTLSKTRFLRGHHLFAQANSLAVAIIDAEVALTGIARVSFKRPVVCGEKVLARAVIKIKKGNKYMVKVTSYVKDEVVFQGRFLIVAEPEEVVPQ
ncbi:transcription factor FapR [Pelotomaculum propionicicum]|nr:transcription factor FapR [Pelotomaculum propionicicum]NLI13279.1 transcription factor FapR [Peptococcaceae bacterium]